jgi:putative redox protein
MSKSTLEVELEWEEGFRFTVSSGDRTAVIDGKRDASPAPTDMLLAAVGACAGIDMVDILEKGRQEVRGLTVTVSGTRRPDPPRFFESMHARFVVRGDVSETKANRAADLSFEKYCSVYHTLRKDLETTWEVVLEP